MAGECATDLRARKWKTTTIDASMTCRARSGTLSHSPGKRGTIRGAAGRELVEIRARSMRNWKFALLACAVALVFAIAIFPAARVSAAKQLMGMSGLQAALRQPAVPFRAGEQLNYRVEWAAFSDAASVLLSVPERRNLYGWSAWHFRAAIHTLGSVRSLFEIDDQFDSYADAATFQTRQFEEYLSELGRKQNAVMHFAATGEQVRGPGPTVVVLPGTLDPLAALYHLRTIDWERTPEFRAPVYDGKNMYEMRARREEANEPVSVAAGEFSTSQISLDLYQYRRLVAGIHFEIWLANDAERAPVVMRADLPFGKLRVELISAKN